MFALAHSYAFAHQQETPTNLGIGKVIFSDLWDDREGDQKKGTPNKQRDNTDKFHLFKTEPSSEANTFLLHLQRNDISFPFLGRRWVGEEEKGRKRKAHTDNSRVFSLPIRLQAWPCFLLFVTH